MTALPDVEPAPAQSTPVTAVGSIGGAYLFTGQPHRDEGGFFGPTLDQSWLRAAGIDPSAFGHDSMVRTRQGVVRGLRLRRGRGEAVLLRCSRGVIMEVIVDLRPHSPTFLQTFAVELRSYPPVTLYIPAGCAHGFQSLTEPADVTYRMDREQDPGEELIIAFDDADLEIAWPLRPAQTLHPGREAMSLSQVLEALR